MSRSDYPRIFPVTGKRLFALLWAVVFFSLINIIIAGYFTPLLHVDFERFSSQIPYEQVDDVIHRIKNDHRKKVVFIGSSVLLGTSIPRNEDTIPAAFRAQLAEQKVGDVAVYNLGYPWSRPLDAYLLTLVLRDSTTLFIVDYNRNNSGIIDDSRVLTSPSSYIRLSRLYQDYASLLYREVPEVKTCFESKHIPLLVTADDRSRIWLQKVMDVIPILRYKNLINIRLFGKHPLVVSEQFFLQTENMLKGVPFSFRQIFVPPEENIISTPWNPFDPGAIGYSPVETPFRESDINNCLVRTFASFAARENLPMVTYLFPTNPLLTRQSHNPSHALNSQFIRSLHMGLRFIDFDDGSFDASNFTDLQHLTPQGAHAFERVLFQALQTDMKRVGILP